MKSLFNLTDIFPNAKIMIQHDLKISPETRTKDNEMISAFMGLTCSDNVSHKYPAGDGICVASRLAYNTSWNWLMPVVEKIDGLNSYSAIHIDNDQVFVHFDKDTEMQDFLNKDYGGKIGAVYKGVTVFIHWYNSQNKNV